MIRKSFARVLAVITLLSLAQGASPLIFDSTGFSKLDAATLPITARIHIGGDPDWLASCFGSVWVSVPKLNEIVRINPLNNTVKTRIPLYKDPRYAISIITPRSHVLTCKTATLPCI